MFHAFGKRQLSPANHEGEKTAGSICTKASAIARPSDKSDVELAYKIIKLNRACSNSMNWQNNKKVDSLGTSD